MRQLGQFINKSQVAARGLLSEQHITWHQPSLLSLPLLYDRIFQVCIYIFNDIFLQKLETLLRDSKIIDLFSNLFSTTIAVNAANVKAYHARHPYAFYVAL